MAGLDPTVRHRLEAAPARSAGLAGHELRVELVAAAGFLTAAVGLLVLLPPGRAAHPAVLVVLVAAFALATRVRFPVSAGHTVPTQLVLVPMLFLAPPRIVPLLAASGWILGRLPDYAAGRCAPSRAISVFGDCWYAVAPALVFALGPVRPPRASDAPLYAAALIAQLGLDVVAGLLREAAAERVRPALQLEAAGWPALVDVLLTPVGALAALASVRHPYAFVLVLPLLGLLALLSRERTQRLEEAVAAAEARREALQVERDASRAREELVAAASHDLKTPTAVVSGLARLLTRDGIPAGRRRDAEVAMQRESMRLELLVQQFTDYTDLAAGRALQVSPAACAVAAETGTVMWLLDGQRVDADIHPALPPAQADPARVRQIIHLLVSRAVTSAKPGRPVRVRAGVAPGVVQVFVDHDAAEGGADGVGLRVARALAEAQGGRLLSRERAEGGLRFTLELPLAVGAEPGLSAATPAAPAAYPA